MSYMGQVSGRAMQSGDIGTDAVTTAVLANLYADIAAHISI